LIPTIETPRLQLRAFSEEGDAAFVLRVLNEPSFYEFIGDRGIRSLDAARRYLSEGPIESYRQHGHGLMWLGIRTSSGRLIAAGMCGLVRRPSLDHPDIGFALLPEHWGQGYVTEAANAVLVRAQAELALGEVYGVTLAHNRRSIRVLEKLGLRFQTQRSLTEGAPALCIYHRLLVASES